jgi:hypothetical protein
MRRIGPFGWILIVAAVVTVVLNVVVPDVGIFAAIVLALLIFAAAAEGMGGFSEVLWDETMVERKRETLGRRFRRGRPEWASTAPDHADEPPELIWERERRRRGLG